MQAAAIRRHASLEAVSCGTLGAHLSAQRFKPTPTALGVLKLSTIREPLNFSLENWNCYFQNSCYLIYNHFKSFFSFEFHWWIKKIRCCSHEKKCRSIKCHSSKNTGAFSSNFQMLLGSCCSWSSRSWILSRSWSSGSRNGIGSLSNYFLIDFLPLCQRLNFLKSNCLCLF